MLALITRPVEDAQPLADALAMRGIDSLVAPLLTLSFFDRPVPDPAKSAALLITSANGARAYARLCARRDLPVYTVGDASARLCRSLGFSEVHSADGDVAALAALVEARQPPVAGPLLHPAGTKLAGDLAGRLSRVGFRVERAVLYEARTADRLPSAAVQALAAGRIGLAPFFSPRTAATFVQLAKQAGLASADGASADGAGADDVFRSVTAFALSPAVADKLAGVAWADCRIAAAPTLEALLRAVDDWRRR